MRRTKFFSLLLAAALLLSLTGCAKGGDAAAPIETGGTYREEPLAIPALADGREQGLLGLAVTAEGLDCFTAAGSGDENNFYLTYYRHSFAADGSVTTREEPWLNAGAPQGGNMMSLRQGADGTLYMVWSDYDEDLNPVNHLLISHDGGATGTELSSRALKDCEPIFAFAPLENGELAVQDMGGALLILDADGELKQELEAGNGCGALTAQGGRLAAYAPSGKAIRVFDLATGESVDWEIALGESSAQLAFAPDGTLYLAASTGLYAHAPDGTLWERFAEGDTISLGLPDYYISSLVVAPGTTDTLYVADYHTNVFRYVYAAGAPAATGEALEIFSLTENKFVRQAVVSFNRSHSGLNVNYTVADEMAGAGTDEDYIKALNTQLLAGSGPDILILDGLPLDSYIEKDVLSELSEIVDGAEPLLENIRNACSEEGKLYAAPLGVRLPLTLSRDGAGEAFCSLAALVQAAETAETPLLFGSSYSYESLAAFLLTYYGEALYTGDESATEDFLTQAGRLCAALGCTDRVGEGTGLFDGWPEDELQDYLKTQNFIVQAFGYVDDLSAALTMVARGLDDGDCMVLCGMADDYGGTLSALSGAFFPSGLAGINKASTQPELAAEFLQALLSEDVQSVAEYSTGFPVNLAALEAIFARRTSNTSCGYNLNDGRELYGEWPNATRRADIRQVLDMVNRPLYENAQLQDMVAPAVVSYLNGSRTLAEATAELKSVLHTYLSE